MTPKISDHELSKIRNSRSLRCRTGVLLGTIGLSGSVRRRSGCPKPGCAEFHASRTTPIGRCLCPSPRPRAPRVPPVAAAASARPVGRQSPVRTSGRTARRPRERGPCNSARLQTRQGAGGAIRCGPASTCRAALPATRFPRASRNRAGASGTGPNQHVQRAFLEQQEHGRTAVREARSSLAITSRYAGWLVAASRSAADAAKIWLTESKRGSVRPVGGVEDMLLQMARDRLLPDHQAGMVIDQVLQILLSPNSWNPCCTDVQFDHESPLGGVSPARCVGRNMGRLYRSSTNILLTAREQQGVNWSLRTRWSSVKYMSRWSGPPPEHASRKCRTRPVRRTPERRCRVPRAPVPRSCRQARSTSCRWGRCAPRSSRPPTCRSARRPSIPMDRIGRPAQRPRRACDEVDEARGTADVDVRIRRGSAQHGVQVSHAQDQRYANSSSPRWMKPGRMRAAVAHGPAVST